MRYFSSFLLSFTLVFPAIAQTSTPVGTVDGKPLIASVTREQANQRFQLLHGRAPNATSDQAELATLKSDLECADLSGQIGGAIQSRQMTRLAIKVSDAEVQTASAQYWTDAKATSELTSIQSFATSVLSAVSDIDKGIDPQRVYTQYGAPLGVPRQIWDMYMNQYKSSTSRAALAAQRNMTAKDIKAAAPPAVRRTLERQRLDAAVDQEIARGDPTFSKYLTEQIQATTQISAFDKRTGSMPTAHRDYLQLKRADWWKNRSAEVSLTLNDPSLVNRCKLASLGVKINGR